MTQAIRAVDVWMRFGAVEALRGATVAVDAGELVAVLGPNGAGKTTLLSILQGRLRAAAGAVTVVGLDPWRQRAALRRRVGVVLQDCEPEPYLTAGELVDLYRGYYEHPRGRDELLEIVGLAGAAGTRVRRLSGGQRRRLDMALALVGDPEVLFLDEPTTGFDPEARRAAWSTIRQLRHGGTTIVLTTHYLDEAEALADRIVVLARGEVVAEGGAADIGGDRRRRVEVALAPIAAFDPGDLPVPVTASAGTWSTSLAPDELVGALHALTTWARRHHVDLEGLTVTRPSLTDVYPELIA